MFAHFATDKARSGRSRQSSNIVVEVVCKATHEGGTAVFCQLLQASFASEQLPAEEAGPCTAATMRADKARSLSGPSRRGVGC